MYNTNAGNSTLGTYIVSSTFSGVSFPWICFIASPALSIAARVSRLIFADSMALICCSRVPICDIVWSRLCSCVFFLRKAAFAAIKGTRQLGPGSVCHVVNHSPVLFVFTFFRAIASCSSICVMRCFSRFCSISSCARRPRMAFLGLSFFFWAAPPPNQPQTPDMVMGKMDIEIKVDLAWVIYESRSGRRFIQQLL